MTDATGAALAAALNAPSARGAPLGVVGGGGERLRNGGVQSFWLLRFSKILEVCHTCANMCKFVWVLFGSMQMPLTPHGKNAAQSSSLQSRSWLLGHEEIPGSGFETVHSGCLGTWDVRRSHLPRLSTRPAPNCRQDLGRMEASKMP